MELYKKYNSYIATGIIGFVAGLVFIDMLELPGWLIATLVAIVATPVAIKFQANFDNLAGKIGTQVSAAGSKFDDIEEKVKEKVSKARAKDVSSESSAQASEDSTESNRAKAEKTASSKKNKAEELVDN